MKAGTVRRGVVDFVFPEWRGSLITELREFAGLTYAQIAHGCGSSASWIVDLERNPSAEPRYSTACRIFAMHRRHVLHSE